MDAEYKPQEPSGYHKEKISDIEKKIEEVKQLSSDEIEQRKKQELQQEVKRYNEQIKKSKKVHKRLNRMLEDVEEWEPPTDNHNRFKEFMIEQIEKTIVFDIMTDFYERELEKCESKITDIVGGFYRKKRLESLNEDLKYHKREYKKDVERCESSNEWIAELMKAL